VARNVLVEAARTVLGEVRGKLRDVHGNGTVPEPIEIARLVVERLRWPACGRSSTRPG
jgi:hypothetical protein